LETIERIHVNEISSSVYQSNSIDIFLNSSSVCYQLNMLTIQQKIEIVLICGENTPHRQVAAIFNTRYPGSNINHSTVSRLMSKFKSTGSVNNTFKKLHNPSKNTEDVQLNVCLDVVEHKITSISDVSERTGVRSHSVRTILHKNNLSRINRNL